MDDQRAGRIVRALRRRLGWRQIDLAHRAGCSQNMISLVERGHLDRVSLRLLRRIGAPLDAAMILEVRWRGAALDRLLDDSHAALVAGVAKELRRLGWLFELEVSYSVYGERGSFDLLAFHPAPRIVLAVEVKTDLPSAEATLRKLDEKARLAAAVAGQRFGWRATSTGRLMVMPERDALRRRVARHAALFGHALPQRNVAIRRWLARPAGRLAGLWFFSDRAARVAIGGGRPGERVRVRKLSARNHDVTA